MLVSTIMYNVHSARHVFQDFFLFLLFVFQEKNIIFLAHVSVPINEKVYLNRSQTGNPASGTRHGQSASTLVYRLFQHEENQKVQLSRQPYVGHNVVVSYSRPVIRHVVCSSCSSSLIDTTALHFAVNSVINVKSWGRQLKRGCTCAEIQYEILNKHTYLLFTII